MDEYWKKSPNSYSLLMSAAHPVHSIVYPYLVEESSSCTRILDFGCGDGKLSAMMPVNAELFLFDESEEFIAIAKHSLSGREAVFYAKKSELLENYYDCVILSFVLMSVYSDDDLLNLLKLVRKIKTLNGKCLIALTHPCFRQYVYSYFYTDYVDQREFKYLMEGDRFNVTLKGNKEVPSDEFFNYHHSISFIVNTLIQSGFSITKLAELGDSSEIGNHNTQFTPYLIIVCQ